MYVNGSKLCGFAMKHRYCLRPGEFRSRRVPRLRSETPFGHLGDMIFSITAGRFRRQWGFRESP